MKRFSVGVWAVEPESQDPNTESVTPTVSQELSVFQVPQLEDADDS